MKILSISGILPIPQHIKDNDFVYSTYRYYNELNLDDEVVIFNPVKYNLNLKTVLKKESRLRRVRGKRSWNIYNMKVEMLPYLSSWKLHSLHSLITSTVFYFNKKRIHSFFTEHQFDIIHAQYIFPDGLLAYKLSKKYNIPFIVTTHNELYYFKYAISKRRALKILGKASKVIPINHTNYQAYKSLGVKNMELVPLGFNEAFLREQRKNSGPTVNIFTVATLIKLKNIDKIILAFNNLVQKHDITLTIIGDGPEKKRLHELASSLKLDKHITFIEYVPHDQIADTMHRYDIFVMPSFFETFGRVYFECMAMGIPIICSKNSGIFGIFKDYEEGLSVDHKNIDDISKALEFLITNPEERLRIGLNGQQLVQNYTWKNIAKKLSALYSETVNKETKQDK